MTPRHEPKRWTTGFRWEAAALAVVAAGAVVRLHNLGAPSLWYDEIMLARVRDVAWGDVLHSALARSMMPCPLSYYLCKAVTTFTESEFWLRLPGALLSIGAIWLLFRLASREGFPVEGLIAALFLALSPFHLRYSRQLRPYAPLVFFTIAIAYAYLRTYRKETAKSWALFVGAGIVGMYFHFFCVLVLLGTAAVEAVETMRAWMKTRILPKRLRAYVLSGALIALTFAPLAYGILTRELNLQHRGRTLTPWRDASAMITHLTGNDYRDAPNLGWTSLVACSFALVGLWRITGKSPRLWLLGMCVVGLIVTYPRTRSFWFLPRYGLHTLPFFALAVGYGAMGLAEAAAALWLRIRRRKTPRLAVTAMALTLGAAVVYYPATMTVRFMKGGDPNQWINWRALGEFIDRNCTGTPLFCTERRGEVADALQYYVRSRKLEILRNRKPDLEDENKFWLLLENYESSQELDAFVGAVSPGRQYASVLLRANHRIPLYYCEDNTTFEPVAFLDRLHPVASGLLLSDTGANYVKYGQSQKGLSLGRRWVDKLPPWERFELCKWLGAALRDAAFRKRGEDRDAALREAVGYLEKALWIQPRNVHVHAYLASTYHALEEYEKAARMWPRVRRAPGSSYFYQSIAIAKSFIELNESERAVEVILWAIEHEQGTENRKRLIAFLEQTDAQAATRFREAKPAPAKPEPSVPRGERTGTPFAGLCYDASAFENLLAGRVERWGTIDVALLFSAGSCFSVPVQDAQDREYLIQICGLRVPTGPVILDVVNPDAVEEGERLLGWITFPRESQRWTTETLTVRLDPSVSHLTFRFANDAITEQGDRNAVVQRVCILATDARQ